MAIPANFAVGAHTLIIESDGNEPISTPVTVIAAGALAATGTDMQGWILAASMLLTLGIAVVATRRATQQV